MKQASILIIDDTPLNCLLLKTFLSQMGFDVTAVQDGQEGIRLLQEQRFHLVLLDWVMPPPDGAAVLNAIKSNPALAPIPLLLISSDTAIDSMTPEQRSHFVGYIPKPFDHERVAAQVSAALSPR